MTIHVTQSMTQVQPYEKAEPCCQPVSHSSSSRSHPESWHSSAAAHRRQQNAAVSHVISRDNELLRDREDVQPLSSTPVSCLAEADHLLTHRRAEPGTQISATALLFPEVSVP